MELVGNYLTPNNVYMYSYWKSLMTEIRFPESLLGCYYQAWISANSLWNSPPRQSKRQQSMTTLNDTHFRGKFIHRALIWDPPMSILHMFSFVPRTADCQADSHRRCFSPSPPDSRLRDQKTWQPSLCYKWRLFCSWLSRIAPLIPKEHPPPSPFFICLAYPHEIKNNDGTSRSGTWGSLDCTVPMSRCSWRMERGVVAKPGETRLHPAGSGCPRTPCGAE